MRVCRKFVGTVTWNVARRNVTHFRSLRARLRETMQEFYPGGVAITKNTCIGNSNFKLSEGDESFQLFPLKECFLLTCISRRYGGFRRVVHHLMVPSCRLAVDMSTVLCTFVTWCWISLYAWWYWFVRRTLAVFWDWKKLRKLCCTQTRK